MLKPPLRVLIVDDSEDLRNLSRIFLESENFEVETAADGKEALQKIAEEDFDLVFMDLKMPVMDGFAAVKKLREEHFEKPVVALTAVMEKSEKERCKAAGFSETLVKPYRQGDLVETVKKYYPASA